MNFKLSQMPERTIAPRQYGLTMVMDKGLSLPEVQAFAENTAQYTDFVKMGFGTSYVAPNLSKKIQAYQSHGIKVYLGGTLFEAFLIRNQISDYVKILKDLNITHVEVSDGSIDIEHKKKCDLISMLKEENFTVLSEVGSKDTNKVMAPYKWLKQMNDELNAGSSYVIAEARESGNIGIYRGSGEVREGLIDEILTQIPQEKIIWEAPHKSQQLFFLQLIGCNVNLGNISPNEVLALEAMRIGLRGDSFYFYLDKEN